MSAAGEVVYIGLGTNLGDRAGNLQRALDALPPAFQLEALSTCYESEPAIVLDQPRFLNAVVRGRTHLPPLAALRRLKALEAELGRAAGGPRYGPRLIDLDLLLYGTLILDTPELTLPHPRLHERAFVLVPLAELAPDLRHPRFGRTMAELRTVLGDTRRLLWPAPECCLALPQIEWP